MSNLLGFVLPAATIGLGALLLRPQRGLFTNADMGPPAPILLPQAVVEEHHVDELHITEHPVEYGARVADHAFKVPAEVTIRWMWSDSPSAPGGLIGAAMGAAAAIGGPIVGNLIAAGSTIEAASNLLTGNSPSQIKDIYQQLLKLQSERTLLSIYTGRRFYSSMLIKSLQVQTDAKTEKSLATIIRCQQILIVRTKTVSLGIANDQAAQANAEKTATTENAGQQQLQPTQNVSVPA